MQTKVTYYGIWNGIKKEFQFSICETSKSKAKRALFKKIGYDAYKWRFESRKLPIGLIPEHILNRNI